MKKRQGFTVFELVVVMVLISLILFIVAKLGVSLTKQYHDTENLIGRTLSTVRIVKTVETIVSGCQSVEVESDRITALSSKGLVNINVSDFPQIENLIFIRSGDNIIINIGGEQYWVPILPEV